MPKLADLDNPTEPPYYLPNIDLSYISCVQFFIKQ